MIDFYLTECLTFLIKLHMASQNLKQFCTQSIFGHNGTEVPPPWLGPVSFFSLRVQSISVGLRSFYKPCSKKFGVNVWVSILIQICEYTFGCTTVRKSTKLCQIKVSLNRSCEKKIQFSEAEEAANTDCSNRHSY